MREDVTCVIISNVLRSTNKVSPKRRYCHLTKFSSLALEIVIFDNPRLSHRRNFRQNDDRFVSASVYRADCRFAPSQWETALLCNDVSHWLGARLESALVYVCTYSFMLHCGQHLSNRRHDATVTSPASRVGDVAHAFWSWFLVVRRCFVVEVIVGGDTCQASHKDIIFIAEGRLQSCFRFRHAWRTVWLRKLHIDVMTRKCFPHKWPFVRGVHRWPVDSLRKGPVVCGANRHKFW